jgi:hypothetical protein
MYEKHYKSISELPLYNWVKVSAGELKYLQKNIDENCSEEELQNAYEILFDDYLTKRGLSKSYKRLLDLMKKKTLLECEYIITGERFKLTEIELTEQMLRSEIGKDTVDISVEKSLVFLSKWIGYRLDWKVVTVSEYYIILEEYGKAN